MPSRGLRRILWLWLALLAFCAAETVHNNSQVEQLSVDHPLLYRRTGQPPVAGSSDEGARKNGGIRPNSINDIFNVDYTDGPASCNNHRDTLQHYLRDAHTLHSALLFALENYEKDVNVRDIVNAWIGVKPPSEDTPRIVKERVGPAGVWTGTQSELNWIKLTGRANAIRNFLAGYGYALQDKFSFPTPILECDDGFDYEMSWDSPFLNAAGEPIEYNDDTTGERRLWPISRAYAQYDADFVRGHYVFHCPRVPAYHFNELPLWTCENYWSNGKRVQMITREYTKSSPPSLPLDTGIKIMPKAVIVCRWSFPDSETKRALDDPTYWTYYDHVDFLPDFDYGHYPEVDPVRPSGSLQVLCPLSISLYHELFHLTDDHFGRTDDYTYKTDRCTRLAENRPDMALANVNCMVFMALSLHIYLRGPVTGRNGAEKPPVVYLNDKPTNAKPTEPRLRYQPQPMTFIEYNEEAFNWPDEEGDDRNWRQRRDPTNPQPDLPSAP